jgi:hypothetical protein
MVSLHVKAALPPFAGRHINDFAAVGEIYRFSILAVELSKLFRAEFFDSPSPPSSFKKKD